MIARALVHLPALLMLDEPCAGLDPAARERFLADLAFLAARDDASALVLATHHVEEIPPFVSRALVLKRGRVLAQGPVEAVVTSRVLSDALEASCEVSRSGGRYSLRIGA